MCTKMNIKKMAVLFACVMLAAMLSGCGIRPEIDASAYVRVWLDCVLKNDPTSAEGSGFRITKEKCNANYEEEINDLTEIFLSNYSEDYEITEELEAEFREIFKELLAKAKYTVGDAREREDGSYVVTVTCEQAQFQKSYEEEYKKACVDLYKYWKQFPASAPTSEEDVSKHVMGLLRDGMKRGLSNITYAAPVEITVTVVPDGKQYKISESDTYKITTELFDIFDISK